MSVVVNLISENRSEYFIKGAPEKIKQICARIPDNYEQTVNNLCAQGYRILALAHKDVNA